MLHEVLGDNKKLSYTYDFGDDWLHEIEMEARTQRRQMTAVVCMRLKS